MSVISFARGIPGPDLLPAEAFGACAPPRPREGSGAGAQLRAAVRLSAAARVGRRAARHRSRAHRAHDRLAAGLQLRRPPLRRRGRDRLRRGAELRPLARDPARARRRDRGDPAYRRRARRGRARGRDRVRRPAPSSSTRSRPSRTRAGARSPREERDRLARARAPRPRSSSRTTRTGSLRFEGEPLPSLFELAGGEGVLFLSSFSKTIAPGDPRRLRDPPRASSWRGQRQVLENYVSPSIFVQAALAEFVRPGHLRAECRADVPRPALRRDAMLAALERDCPEGSRWNGPRAATSSGWTSRPA